MPEKIESHPIEKEPNKKGNEEKQKVERKEPYIGENIEPDEWREQP